MKILTLNQPQIADFSRARNQLMKNITQDWVLFLDSDETLSESITKIKLDQHYNYAFKRQDWFLGRKLRFGETNQVKLVRLVQPGSGRWQGKVHERFVSSLQGLTLKAVIEHRRKINLSQFLERLNYYSSLRAQELSGEKFNYLKLLFFPLGKFIQNYFFRLGFLDGVPGLAMAFFMSLHSLAVRVKQYEAV
jgi:glycosyltransferase involved in cell wall biosynthesis